MTTYVFWIRGWHCISDIGGGTFSRCRVTDDALHLDLPPTANHAGTTWTIPLEQIINCEHYVIRSSHLSLDTVHLRFDTLSIKVNQWKRKELFLHIFEPIWGEEARDEAECLVSVVEAKKNKIDTALHPNPYYRAFERHNRIAEFREVDWDAMKPISEFQEQPLIKELVFERKLADLQTGSAAIYIFGALVLIMIGYFWNINEPDGAIVMAVLGSPLIALIFYFRQQIRKLKIEQQRTLNQYS